MFINHSATIQQLLCNHLTIAQQSLRIKYKLSQTKLIMSITNEHPIVRNIIENNPTSSKKWTLIFFDLQISNQPLLEKYFYQTTISCIANEILLDKIYLYTYQEKQQIFDYTYKIEILQLPRNIKSVRLSILKNFINNSFNIIMLGNGCGYISKCGKSCGLHKINCCENIYAKILEVDEDNKIYEQCAKKFELENIVCTSCMIIPYNEKNKEYVNLAFQISNGLCSTNENFISNMSVSVANIKLGCIVCDILDISDKFLDINNKAHMSICREWRCEQSKCEQSKCEQSKCEQIAYNNPNYWYYPYFDIDSGSLNLVKSDTNLPTFNTNGFGANITSIYSSIFKRFETKNSGLFVKKETGDIIIPKILHHVWPNETKVDDKYTEPWRRILREPWQYMLWTRENIAEFIANSKWKKVLGNDSVVPFLAILEEYGGIVIDSHVFPFGLFNDDFMKSKFFVSFSDESVGTELSFRVMGAVPGKKKGVFVEGEIDEARKPFEGINNFFRFAAHRNKEKNKQKSNNGPRGQSNCTNMFEIFFGALTLREDLRNTLMHSSDVMIYPSCYFNPNCYTNPKPLLKSAICAILWKKPEIKVRREKTKLTRTYNLTQQGIISQLCSDPKDKLGNDTKI